MKERPIIFSSPMVRAILEGRKTQTRRVAKVHETSPGYISPDPYHTPRSLAEHVSYCPYGVPGDQLWCRESAIITPKHWDDGGTFTHLDAEGGKRWVQYLATSPDCEEAKGYGLKITPSIFMPRWASRITLEITDVRVQRVQEISHSDALSEGVEYDVSKPDGSPLCRFQHLWDSINAKRGYGWDTNSWVWAITFRRVE